MSCGISRIEIGVCADESREIFSVEQTMLRRRFRTHSQFMSVKIGLSQKPARAAISPAGMLTVYVCLVGWYVVVQVELS